MFIMQREKVVSAIADGIQIANQTYEKWTNGCWLNDDPVEHIMSVKIAETIFETALNQNGNRNETLALEVSFSKLETSSQCDAKPGTKPKVLQPKHRVDIALFHANTSPAAVIEVKRTWSQRSCARDLERLIALLRRYGKINNGSLKFACLAVFLAFELEDQLNSKYSEIDEFIRDFFGNRGLNYQVLQLPSKQYSDLDYLWFSGGVVISSWFS